MIKAFKIESLFGIFNHEILLKEDGLTIIHGENGIGKTIFLELISNFVNDNLKGLSKVPFKSFSIIFSDNSIILLETKKVIYVNSSRTDFFISLVNNGFIHDKVKIRLQENIYQKSLKYDSELNRHIQKITPVSKFKGLLKDKLMKLSDLNLHYLNTQRIIQFNENNQNKTTFRIKKVAQDLTRLRNTRMAEFTTFSYSSGSEYLSRLYDIQNNKEVFTKDILVEKLNYFSKIRDEYKKLGLISSDDDSNWTVEPEYLNDNFLERQIDSIKLFIIDIDRKIKFFEDLAKRIRLFKDMIEDNFSYKRFEICNACGFHIKSKITGRKIELENLSSGEQHWLILFYELIFKTNKDNYILIDEPEISLHIKWQERFLDDLYEIMEMNNFKTIIATHSPSIINGYWKNTISLKYER